MDLRKERQDEGKSDSGKTENGAVGSHGEESLV
jgi:hypothetical protein